MSKKKLESTRYGTWSNKNVLKIIFFKESVTLPPLWSHDKIGWVERNLPQLNLEKKKKKLQAKVRPASYINFDDWSIMRFLYLFIWEGKKQAKKNLHDMGKLLGQEKHMNTHTAARSIVDSFMIW